MRFCILQIKVPDTCCVLISKDSDNPEPSNMLLCQAGTIGFLHDTVSILYIKSPSIPNLLWDYLALHDKVSILYNNYQFRTIYHDVVSDLYHRDSV